MKDLEQYINGKVTLRKMKRTPTFHKYGFVVQTEEKPIARVYTEEIKGCFYLYTTSFPENVPAKSWDKTQSKKEAILSAYIMARMIAADYAQENRSIFEDCFRGINVRNLHDSKDLVNSHEREFYEANHETIQHQVNNKKSFSLER